MHCFSGSLQCGLEIPQMVTLTCVNTLQSLIRSLPPWTYWLEWAKDRTNNRECTSLASQLASGGMIVGRDTLITYLTASQQPQLLVWNNSGECKSWWVYWNKYSGCEVLLLSSLSVDWHNGKPPASSTLVNSHCWLLAKQ